MYNLGKSLKEIHTPNNTNWDWRSVRNRLKFSNTCFKTIVEQFLGTKTKQVLPYVIEVNKHVENTFDEFSKV